MKKALLALALILPAGAMASMSCSDLLKNVQRTEAALSGKYHKQKCEAESDKELYCSSLATVSLKLTQAEHELALLDGMEKLKAEVVKSKLALAALPPLRAEVAALSFADKVIIGQSLDLIANAPDGATRLKRLQTDLAANPQVKVADYFKDITGFAPSDAAVKEIKAIALSGTDFTPALMTEWKNALFFERDDVKFTFSKMREDLGIQGTVPRTFSREQITKLQGYPDFRSTTKLDLVAHMNLEKKNLVNREKFKFLMDDMNDRQKVELQAKISTAFQHYRTKFTTAFPADGCPAAKSDYTAALSCLDKMRAAEPIGPEVAGDLRRLYAAADISKSYIDNVTGKQAACVTAIEASSQTATGSPDFSVCEGILSRSRATLSEQITKLKALKDDIEQDTAPEGIHASSQELLRLRNYALGRLQSQPDCVEQLKKTELAKCDDDLERSTGQAISQLTGDVMDISLTVLGITPPVVTEAEVADICNKDPVAVEAADLCSSAPAAPVVSGGGGQPDDDRDRPERRERRSRREKEDRSPIAAGIAAGLPGLAYQIGQDQRLMQAEQAKLQYALWMQNYNPYLYGTSTASYYIPSATTFDNPLFYTPTSGVSPYSSFTSSPISTPSGSSSSLYITY